MERKLMNAANGHLHRGNLPNTLNIHPVRGGFEIWQPSLKRLGHDRRTFSHEVQQQRSRVSGLAMLCAGYGEAGATTGPPGSTRGMVCGSRAPTVYAVLKRAS